MKTRLNATPDPTQRTSEGLEFDMAIWRKIVRHEAQIEKVAEIYQMFLAGGEPIGWLTGKNLLVRPISSRKTRVVEVMGQSRRGNPRVCIKIDRGEFQRSHEIFLESHPILDGRTA